MCQASIDKKKMKYKDSFIFHVIYLKFILFLSNNKIKITQQILTS